MEVAIYFPHVDPRLPGRAELRNCFVSGAVAGTSSVEITSNPSPAVEEQANAHRAISAVRRWEEPAGLQPISMFLDSGFASEGTSCQLAVAAADWLFRNPKVQPARHLVATGALPEPHAVRRDELRVLRVEWVKEKAEQVLKDLESEKLAGAPVLFCYPASNASDPGLVAVLGRFPSGRATALAIGSFAELLDAWVPGARALKTMSVAEAPGAPMAPKSRRGRLSWVIAGAIAVGAMAVAMIPGAVPQLVAMVNGDSEALALANSAGRSPDHPTAGCPALVRYAESSPIAPGYGRGPILARLEACRALEICDERASSPMERPQGVRLDQMTERRDQLEEARATCTRAAAAFPSIARLPFQLARALEAGNEPALQPAAREARNRAVELGHPMATIELLREQARHEPELVRARLQLLSQGQDAHPEALVTLGELLACGQLPIGGQVRGGTPAPSDLRDAAELFARLPSLPAAARMSGDLRGAVAGVERSIRQAMLANPPARPLWCQRVVASIGG